MPTADLLDDKPGRTDEDELGISYDQIDEYLEGGAVPDEVAEKIEQRYLMTRHKRTTPVSILDKWWRSLTLSRLGPSPASLPCGSLPGFSC